MREAVGRLGGAFPPVWQRVKGITASDGRRAGNRPILSPSLGAGLPIARPSTAGGRPSDGSCHALRIGSKSRPSASRVAPWRRMPLARVDATAPGEAAQKSDLRPVIERRHLDPFFERSEPLAGIHGEPATSR